jgi:hypothetical protein
MRSTGRLQIRRQDGIITRDSFREEIGRDQSLAWLHDEDINGSYWYASGAIEVVLKAYARKAGFGKVDDSHADREDNVEGQGFVIHSKPDAGDGQCKSVVTLSVRDSVGNFRADALQNALKKIKDGDETPSKIFIPINTGGHWTMVGIEVKKGGDGKYTFDRNFYNPSGQGSVDARINQQIEGAIRGVFTKGDKIAINDAKGVKSAAQADGSSCGPISCWIAGQVMADAQVLGDIQGFQTASAGKFARGARDLRRDQIKLLVDFGDNQLASAVTVSPGNVYAPPINLYNVQAARVRDVTTASAAASSTADAEAPGEVGKSEACKKVFQWIGDTNLNEFQSALIDAYFNAIHDKRVRVEDQDGAVIEILSSKGEGKEFWEAIIESLNAAYNESEKGQVGKKFTEQNRLQSRKAKLIAVLDSLYSEAAEDPSRKSIEDMREVIVQISDIANLENNSPFFTDEQKKMMAFLSGIDGDSSDNPKRQDPDKLKALLAELAKTPQQICEGLELKDLPETRKYRDSIKPKDESQWRAHLENVRAVERFERRKQKVFSDFEFLIGEGETMDFNDLKDVMYEHSMQLSGEGIINIEVKRKSDGVVMGPEQSFDPIKKEDEQLICLALAGIEWQIKMRARENEFVKDAEGKIKKGSHGSIKYQVTSLIRNDTGERTSTGEEIKKRHREIEEKTYDEKRKTHLEARFETLEKDGEMWKLSDDETRVEFTEEQNKKFRKDWMEYYLDGRSGEKSDEAREKYGIKADDVKPGSIVKNPKAIGVLTVRALLGHFSDFKGNKIGPKGSGGREA